MDSIGRAGELKALDTAVSGEGVTAICAGNSANADPSPLKYTVRVA